MMRVAKTLALAAMILLVQTTSAQTVSASIGQHIELTDTLGSGRTLGLTLQSGSSALHFSNGSGDPINGAPSRYVGGVVAALNEGKVRIAAVDGSNIVERQIASPYYDDTTPIRGFVKIDESVSSISADAVTGALMRVSTIGGAQWVADPLGYTQEGGALIIRNMSIDLVNKRVYADMLANEGTDYQAQRKQLHLWDITAIDGPIGLTYEALASGDPESLVAFGYDVSVSDGQITITSHNVLSGLKITQAGQDFMTDALGIPLFTEGARLFTLANNLPEGWGTMTATLVFTSLAVGTIPEPATYVLMGMGLAGVFAATYRRS